MTPTHRCGSLTEEAINEQVVLLGWVHRRRDHGGLVFLDLRDHTGLTQIVVATKELEAGAELVREVRNEYVLGVEGVVRKRPPGTENPKLPTGRIEIGATRLELVNPSEPLPFEIDDAVEVSEELRLTYRYLDLRRPQMQRNLRLRHHVCQVLRSVLDREGFLEVETPMLTKSTPEGARDYLVPSRLNPGSFYALPQSPQLFKQLLMVAGCGRYYQFARCFRDEDLRADRQPEFTQLDIEMSFVDEEEIFRLLETLLKEVVHATRGIELEVPFPRLTYEEAMKRFGTDRPDLRTRPDELRGCWVVDFPLFRFDETQKRWDTEHHPFTAPRDEDLPLLESDPGRVRARAYDLVLNGVEIGSGSIRIHRAELQRTVLRRIGLTDTEIEERFGFLLQALAFGAPPHGGIAPSLLRTTLTQC